MDELARVLRERGFDVEVGANTFDVDLDIREIPMMTKDVQTCIASYVGNIMVSTMAKSTDITPLATQIAVGRILSSVAKVLSYVFDTILGAQLLGGRSITFCVPNFPVLLKRSDFARGCSIVLPLLQQWIQEVFASSTLSWRVDTHHYFHPQTRQQVKTALLCWYHQQHFERTTFSNLPIDCLYVIFGFVCAPPFVCIKTCMGCGCQNNGLLRCGRCKRVYFCGRGCQAKSNARHTKWCQEMASNTNDAVVFPSFTEWETFVLSGEGAPPPLCSNKDTLFTQYVREQQCNQFTANIEKSVLACLQPNLKK